MTYKKHFEETCQIARDDDGTIMPIFVCARNRNVMHGPSVAASRENDAVRACHRWRFV
jgi:peptide/nickel transport system substrate-binding protein